MPLGMAGGGLVVALLSGAFAAHGGLPLDPRQWGSDVPRAASIGAALDTLDASRWGFVHAIVVGSLPEVARIADARERAMDTLSRGVTDPELLASVPWPDRTRWIELGLSERRRDWLRPLLEAWSEELPPVGDPLRGPAALDVGLASLQLYEEDPEEEPAFLGADPHRSLDSVAVRSFVAAAALPTLLRDEAMHRLATRAEAEGDTAVALAWADSLLLTEPESPRAPQARLIRARGWLAAGRAPLAEEESRRGLAVEPLPELRWVLASAYLAQGRTQDSVRELDEIMRGTPTDPVAARAFLARLRLGAEDSTLALAPAESVRLLEALLPNPALDAEARLTALSDDPETPPALRDEASLVLAKFQYRGKRYAPAEERLQDLVDATDPTVAGEARLHLARILRNTGRTDAMTREYRALLEGPAERSALAAWELGREWESLARWSDAERAYSDLLERHPDSSRRRDALFRRGFTRDRQGKTEAALRDFRSALNASRTPAEREQAAFWAARALRDEGHEAQARDLARESVGALPADAYGVFLVEWFGLVESSFPVESSPRGAPSIQGPPTLPAASSSVRRGLDRGLAYLKRGIQDAGRVQLRAVASNAGRSPEVLQALARAAAGYGLYPEGILWANRALEGTPPDDADIAGLRRLAYPAAHAGRVVPEARKHDVDPALVWALMRQESLYDARAVSRAGALGLMQVMPATLARMTQEMNTPPLPAEVLLHPDVNITYGTQFLAERLAEFENQLLPTLASYNAGEGKARDWLGRSGGNGNEVFLECIGYAETYGYVRRILWLRWMYHALYGVTPETSDK